MKNKHGEIPIVILVIGIFAVCSLALVTFFISDTNFKQSFVGLDLMEKANIQIENQSFHEISSDNFYLEKKIDASKWYSWEKKEKVVFSVKYNLP